MTAIVVIFGFLGVAAPVAPGQEASQDSALSDVPLLLVSGQRRDVEEKLRELEQIDLAPVGAAIATEPKNSDPTIGPIRFPITSLAPSSGGDDIITASSFFPVQAYFDGSVDPSAVTNLNLDRLMDIRLGDDFSLDLGAGFFWRDSKEDRLNGAANRFVTGAEAEGQGYLGTELSIVLEWEINKNFSLMTSYSHFFADSFRESHGLGEDIDFFGVSAAFKF